MKKVFTFLFCACGLSACSSTTANFSGFDYMDRTELAELRGNDNVDEVKYDYYGNHKTVRTYAAVSVDRFDDTTGKNDPVTVDIKRLKSRVYAETRLYESDNKDKTFFDESMFNFGYDKKAHNIGMELSLKW